MFGTDHHVVEGQQLKYVKDQVIFHAKPTPREQFSASRWPFTYANDFVRTHEDIIPDAVWDEIEISGPPSRAQASIARTKWANSLGLLDVDVAEMLACGYIIENNVDLSSTYARDTVPTWVLTRASAEPENSGG